MPLVKLDGVAVANIVKRDGIAIANIAKIGGVEVSTVKVAMDDYYQTTGFLGNATGSRAITTGINLSANDGMLWSHNRDNLGNAALTVAGFNFISPMNSANHFALAHTNAGVASSTHFTSFDTDGVTLNSGTDFNTDAENYALHSFRNHADFMRCFEYTGDGTANRNLAHGLNKTPGFYVIHANSGGIWYAYHSDGWPSSTPQTSYSFRFNTTGNPNALNIYGTGGVPDGTNIHINGIAVNTDTTVYTCFAFVHDTDADGVCQCGGAVMNGSGNYSNTSLGWKPQMMIIGHEGGSPYHVFENKVRDTSNPLSVWGNTNGAEDNDDPSTSESGSQTVDFNADGFDMDGFQFGESYWWVAIREA